MFQPATDINSSIALRWSSDGTALEAFLVETGVTVLHLPLPGNTGSPAPMMANAVPTSDPHVVGEIYSNSGVLTVSAG